jgi:hypothetical protein
MTTIPRLRLSDTRTYVLEPCLQSTVLRLKWLVLDTMVMMNNNRVWNPSWRQLPYDSISGPVARLKALMSRFATVVGSRATICTYQKLRLDWESRALRRHSSLARSDPSHGRRHRDPRG